MVLEPGTATERIVEETSPGEQLRTDELCGGRQDFMFPASGVSFFQYTPQVETFTCAGAPAGGASGEGS